LAWLTSPSQRRTLSCTPASAYSAARSSTRSTTTPPTSPPSAPPLTSRDGAGPAAPILPCQAGLSRLTAPGPPAAPALPMRQAPSRGHSLGDDFLQAGEKRCHSQGPSRPGLLARLQAATTYAWNVSIEQQFTATTGFRLAYVGSETEHLSVAIDMNPPYASKLPVNKNIGDIFDDQSWATASYNSLQVSLDQHMWRGLQVQSSFTWSHTLDIASSSNISFGNPALGNPISAAWTAATPTRICVELDQQLYLPGPLAQGKGQANGRDGRRLAVEQHHHRAGRQPFSIGQWNTDPESACGITAPIIPRAYPPTWARAATGIGLTRTRATSTRQPSNFPSPVTTKRRDGAVSATRAGTPTGDRAYLASMHRL